MHLRAHFWQLPAVICLFVWACCGHAGAEGESDSDPPASKSRQHWDKTFEEWKEILIELHGVREEYIRLATEEELPELRKEYDTLLRQGNKKFGELRAAGLAAYVESPNSDQEINDFLYKLVDNDLRAERYHDAYDLSSQLVAAEFKDKHILELAGAAAFSTNHFTEAKRHFAAAAKVRSLSPNARQLAQHCDKMIDLWGEETKLREAEAAADDLPRVKLTTTRGDIILELFENEAPDTVGNFVSLVKKEFYDGRKFHRVVPYFVAQTGCPKGDGSGGPGYKIYCETDHENHRKHFAGSLSMAHAGKDTGGSQFFLVLQAGPQPTGLNGRHTVFGRVVEGWNTLANINRFDPSKRRPPNSPPPRLDSIISAEVLRDRGHDYQPNKVE